MDSTTAAGLADPSTSIVVVSVACTPPLTSATEVSFERARTSRPRRYRRDEPNLVEAVVDCHRDAVNAIEVDA